ncbi:glutamate-tRNA ligase [Blattabacterium sp. (Blattella germanica) str. Bge]|uniref:glutamate--tRNA ligase n=1 Tax=Blattabacterium sp. (Blattella germanica) TaxID=624186 RepID=UPI0001BB6191|nr:glutamate--tRNA ligase [Blattabacterium sp. (Blattella germanica)]ACY40347.1 glutamate-tRNA ligase [Blattabacterium sp. (Blattella germanica) str. Bge]
MSQNFVRVRFAPSPTGPLHLGGIRTALYNYLFAKRHGGTFILRIEDTDQKRFVSNSESYILETLKWCRIEPDEGVGVGGPYSPYYQSKRCNIYRFYINQLLEKGDAYYAFDTDIDIDKKRKEYSERGFTFSYNNRVRMDMDNSLTMTKEQLHDKLQSCSSYVIRFKVKPGEKLKMHDLIRGEIIIDSDHLDDKILLKSDGVATYHLANTIDDHLMKITHVLRGEEWLSSMSLHILLYRSFGWTPPLFAHLPLILRKDGKGKISKRNASSLDYPIFPIQWKVPDTQIIIPGYRELGYFPEAFVNMLALLGWNPGVKNEIFSLQELVNFFSLERINKSGVFFDLKKANWFNKKYLNKKKKKCFHFFAKNSKKRFIQCKKDYLWKIIHLTIDRIHFIHEIWEHSFYFFISPSSYEANFFNKICHKKSILQLEDTKILLSNVNPFTSINLKSLFTESQKEKQKIMQLFRLALVGILKGIDIFMIFEMLGKEESIQRIEKLINQIKEKI